MEFRNCQSNGDCIKEHDYWISKRMFLSNSIVHRRRRLPGSGPVGEGGGRRRCAHFHRLTTTTEEETDQRLPEGHSHS